MLVLTRDLKDSTLLIGDDIEVKVVNVKGNQVRLAITAPDDVNIVRTELLPAEEQPKDLPATAPKSQERSPRTQTAKSTHPPSGNRAPSQRTRGARSGYQDPRQLTPNYATRTEPGYAEKNEKTPVISTKRRRRIPSDEDGA